MSKQAKITIKYTKKRNEQREISRPSFINKQTRQTDRTQFQTKECFSVLPEN